MRTRHAALLILIALPVAGAEPATADAADALGAPASSESRAYSQVLIRPLRLEYTPEFLADDVHRRQPVRGEDVERIQQYYREIVEKTLAPGFTSASEPGPSVALLEGVLVDHEIDKDEWKEPTQLTFRGAPEVQIVAYLRDSETGEPIDTVGLTIQPQPGRLMKSSPGFYWDFMQKVFDRLATRVRWSLEDRNP